jgi:hypothetical protein
MRISFLSLFLSRRSKRRGRYKIGGKVGGVTLEMFTDSFTRNSLYYTEGLK